MCAHHPSKEELRAPTAFQKQAGLVIPEPD
jgi:hypothetical protein